MDPSDNNNAVTNDEGSYDNYTFEELFEFFGRKYLREHKCPFNKNDIIQMIKDNNLAVPKKHEPMEHTKWDYYYDRPWFEWSRRNIVYTKKKDLRFMREDIFQMDNELWFICAITPSKESLEEFDARDNSVDSEDEEKNKVMYIHYCKHFINIDDYFNSEKYTIDVNEFLHKLDTGYITVIDGFIW